MLFTITTVDRLGEHESPCPGDDPQVIPHDDDKTPSATLEGIPAKIAELQSHTNPHPTHPAVVQPFPPAVVHPCAPAILTTCPELRSRDYHGAVGIRVNQSPHPVQAELVRRGVEVVPCVGKPKFWGI